MKEDLYVRPPDPVDLMMEGKFDEAINVLLAMYVEAARRGDNYIGTDLCVQLLHCVAVQEKRLPEESATKVEKLIRAAMSRDGLTLDEDTLRRQMEGAAAEVKVGRVRAEEGLRRFER